MIPRALLFDFDGVILDTEWPLYQKWLTLFRTHGHDLPLETYVQCIGSDFNTWSPETHLEGLIGKSLDWPSVNAEADQLVRENIGKLDAMLGVRETLTRCQKLKITCSVVSSSTHNWVDHWLEKLGLMNHFCEIVCRGDAPQIKPAPDLYLEAVKRSGFAAKECLVIEDSLNGMKAAHDAGCPVVIIPNRTTAGTDFSAAESQFSSMEEFVATL